MNYILIHKGNNKYIECLPDGERISSEQDALDWVSVCGENEAYNLMLHGESLSDDFFDLSTGLAGAVLLKFSIYSIRLAAVLAEEKINQGKFRDMVLETNRGNQFRVFLDRQSAEEWLVG